MTAIIDDTPGSISDAQIRKLMLSAKAQGVNVAGLHEIIGGSLHSLSKAAAAAMIERFTGQKLPPPGTRPKARLQRRRGVGAIRMMTAAHVSQIEQLLADYFQDESRAANWLEDHFRAREPWKLGTARIAGKVIFSLKNMLDAKRPLWHSGETQSEPRAQSPRSETLKAGTLKTESRNKRHPPPVSAFLRFCVCLSVSVFCSGCLIDAGRLAGFSKPGLEIKKRDDDWVFTASTDFVGTGRVRANPDGSYVLDVDMKSKASPVITAEGERADHLIELRKIEAANNAALLRAVERTIGTIAALIPGLTAPQRDETPPFPRPAEGSP